MLKGFKQFILKGNAVDLAIGVVIGVSFQSVVNSLVKDLINPLVGVFGGQPDFSRFSFTINGSKFLIGNFVNSLVSLLIIALIIYFFVIVPMNRLSAQFNRGKSLDPSEKKCPECLGSIPIKARKCQFCTSSQLQN